MTAKPPDARTVVAGQPVSYHNAPATKLGKLQSAPAIAKQPDPTSLARFLGAGLRGELVTLPALGPAYIELAGHDVVNQIESEVFRELGALDLHPTAINGLTYDAERARRTLSRCVRDADDRTKPFGTVEEWGQVDSDVIAACWQVYADVRYRLDPVGTELSEDDMHGIVYALEKKSPTLLRSFGAAKLSLYLLTSAARPASSPTPPSSSGESSADTSATDPTT